MRNYRYLFDNSKAELDLSTYQNVIDIGCGTGALCKVLQEYELNVTALDSAEAMLLIARKRIGTTEANEPCFGFICGDVLKGLSFKDKSFDLAITSYVAHGLTSKERLILYKEMKRVAKRTVVLLDYNEHRSMLTNLVEWLEGGEYFSFIRSIRGELMKQFGNLKVINTGKYSAMYICKID